MIHETGRTSAIRSNVAMDAILTSVSTTYKNQTSGNDSLVEVVRPKEPAVRASFQATTPEQALDILKSEPDHVTLIQTLEFLVSDSSKFDITSPSPVTSQIVHVLVNEILPSYWSVLSEGSISVKPKSRKSKQDKHTTELRLLMTCLRSITGFNSFLLAFKRNIQLSRDSRKTASTNPDEILAVLLQALEALIEGPYTIESIWSGIWTGPNTRTPKKAVWAELLGLIAGGKLLGSAAEAEDIVNTTSSTVGQRHWIADGNLYSNWLAKNIRHWAKKIGPESETEQKCCAELLSKSFRIIQTGVQKSPFSYTRS